MANDSAPPPPPAHPLSTSALQELILPALACLPTAFISPVPPPDFIPLLSPVIRQRVYLSAASATSENDKPPSQRDNWLSLLTWSRDRAAELQDVVSRMLLEAHPVSGEIELFGHSSEQDDGKAWYRQPDDETTQARCNIHQHHIAFIWVWCTNDTGGTGLEALAGKDVGEGESGWKIAEVVPLQEEEDLEADGWSEDFQTARNNPMARSSQSAADARVHVEDIGKPSYAASNGDDDYWAAYDRTPGDGSRKQSAANLPETNGFRRVDSDDYFARYGNEVQPAMDAHDPDEEAPDGQFESTLHGNHVSAPPAAANSAQPRDRRRSSRDRSATLRPEDFASYGQSLADAQSHGVPPAMQEPYSKSVVSLEAAAANAGAVETTVRQHISGEIKHLYRLARGVGIDHDDFRNMVERETELLGLLGLDN